jgi:hypothetical protein
MQVEREYNAGGKAGWSAMQVERLKYYTGGRLEEMKYFFSIIPA